MLTVFILPSDNRRDIEKTKKSLNFDFKVEFKVVENHDQINNTVKKSPWYAVFYDNEYIEERLKEAFLPFLLCSKLDYLVLFEYMEKEAKFFPRIYRDWIKINSKLEPVGLGLNLHEKILNGWLLKHGSIVKGIYPK